MDFIKKRKKIIQLINFSIQEVSTGQVKSMIDYLTKNKNIGFKDIKVDYKKNSNQDLRCYLTIEYHHNAVVQWFEDRNPSQVEGFAKSFHINEKGEFELEDICLKSHLF